MVKVPTSQEFESGQCAYQAREKRAYESSSVNTSKLPVPRRPVTTRCLLAQTEPNSTNASRLWLAEVVGVE